MFRFIFLIFFPLFTLSQSSFEHISNESIYLFLDELANDHIIELNSCVKPYTQKFIYDKLNTALSSKQLTNKQIEEINFYLIKFSLFSKFQSEKANNFNNIKKSEFSLKKIRFTYKDSSINLLVSPIWGIDFKTGAEKQFTHLYGGIDVRLSYKNWTFYSNLRDNTMSEVLKSPNFISNQFGGIYKTWLNNDFSEMRGGVVFSNNKLSVAIIKDHIEWGDNYNGSNILSGRTPSYCMIKLNLKPISWLDFNYHHGWLVSEVIDSSNSYLLSNNTYKFFNRPKYIASNLLTIRTFKKFNISLGNSIVYSDLNGIHPAYLIPVFFYKSIDHTLNSNVENQNSQFFMNFSSRNIKYLHVYSSIFVDEFQKNRLFSDTLLNFISFKSGFRLTNYPFRDLSLVIEYTRNNPFTYKHHIDVTTFETNRYNLGHYLNDNSSELYLSAKYKLTDKIDFNLEYINSLHGEDFSYTFFENYTPGQIRFIEDIVWQKKSIILSITSEFINNTYLSFSYNLNNIIINDNITNFDILNYVPEFYIDNPNIFSFSLNISY